MITNYKDEFKKLTKKQLLDYIEVTPYMVEKIEVLNEGATHVDEVNGPDGVYNEGQHLEIKTQKYTGNFEFHGRGKFGSPTFNLHTEKLASDMTVLITGFNDADDGQLFYRFKFNFAAIASRYRNSCTDKITGLEKMTSNWDCYPPHYSKHSTFVADWIAPDTILDANAHKFQPKFLQFLKYLNANNYKQPTFFY